MTRVSVFIDYQNVYMGARAAVGADSHNFVAGQVYPRRLGVLLTDRGRVVDPNRQLADVFVFRGEPSADHSRTGQAACQRQVRYWNAQTGVRAVTRPLNYRPIEWEHGKPRRWDVREKGIDVLVALGMVLGAIHDQYDVCVLVSSDTDLTPAVEQVLAAGKRCEVAAWSFGTGGSSRLAPKGVNVWCHWLKEHDYLMVHDPTDYTRPHPGEPSAAP